jgi:PAS domain S-box-containing protein
MVVRSNYSFLEKELKLCRAQLLRLEAIVEASLDAIYAIDTEGIILSWNKAAEQIFGFSKEEIIGQSIKVLAFSEQEGEIDYLINVIKQGRAYSYETVRQKKDGQLVAVFITLAPMKDSTGKVIGSSAVARDVTEHRKLEKEIAQLDKLNTIVELASVISHEVRNPMTTVRGFLQHLYNKIEDAKFREYFDLMIEEIDRTNSILQGFNSVAQNKGNDRSRCNLGEVIKTLAPLLETDAVSQGKTIKLDLKDTPDILANGNEIRQIILNLTRNALEAMKPGGCVTIRTYQKEDKVVLEVQDQGKGIKPEYLEKLGSPFFSTKESGTGLGLYVCYEIAQRHDAKIGCQTADTGTTFMVEFESLA